MVDTRLAHLVIQQQGWLGDEGASPRQDDLAQVRGQGRLGVELFQVSGHAPDDGVGGDALRRGPTGEESTQGAEAQWLEMPLPGESAEQRGAWGKEGLHNVD